MSFQDAASRMAQRIRKLPPGSRFYLDCDVDADGLCAAAVASTALRRAGYRFQVSASRDKTDAAYRTLVQHKADAYMLLDKGSGNLNALDLVREKTGSPVFIVDHHNVEGDGDVHILNPRKSGLDGSRDACAATTALALALALDPKNLDLTGIALAGAVGDWQHRGGWQGWNLEALEAAAEAGHVFKQAIPAPIGVHLAEALSRMEPEIPGLTGDLPAVEAWLSNLGLDPHKDPEDLSPDEQGRVVSAWSLQVLAAGHDAEAATHMVRQDWHDRRTGFGIRHLFRIVDACGRQGHAGTGLAFLYGDPEAKDAAMANFTRYKEDLAKAIERLREEGSDRRQAMQVIWTDEPAYTGMVGGLGMTIVLEDRTVPAIILAKREDGRIQVSTRGTHEQVEAGMDLGQAIRQAAATVDSEGGGHPIASGAIIEEDRLDDLLDAIDEILLEQDFQ